MLNILRKISAIYAAFMGGLVTGIFIGIVIELGIVMLVLGIV